MNEVFAKIAGLSPERRALLEQKLKAQGITVPAPPASSHGQTARLRFRCHRRKNASGSCSNWNPAPWPIT